MIFIRIIPWIIVSFFLYPIKSTAQVIPDNTLDSENSTIRSLDETKDRIEGGAIRGDNLFHSFTEFTVQEGTQVDFANPVGVTNIFSRVTGNNLSEISGIITVDGVANLFLLNPNGIVFGENAGINIQGSFLVTTADDIEFNNGSKFSSIDQETPLLTINFSDFPIGLNMGNDPGAIQVNGQGHNLVLNVSEKTFRPPAFSRLGIDSGNTLALIGGDIVFDGGVITAENSHLELASLSGGNVKFSSRNLNKFQYNTSQFRNILFLNSSLADASGVFGGSITVLGNNISFESGSGLFIQNSSQRIEDNISINANSINISGGEFTQLLRFPDRGFVETNADAQTVRGGLLDGIFLPSNLPLDQVLESFNLSTNEAEIVPAFLPSFIFSESIQNGQGKNIIISAKELFVSSGSQLITRSFDTAKAGNININTTASRVEGASSRPEFDEFNFEIFSQINSSAFDLGIGGNISINTNSLITTNGAAISSTNNGAGVGGSLNINADTIDLSGIVSNVFLPSSIAAGTISEGNSGNITINTNNIYVRNGAAISTATLASGDAGQIKIQAAREIEIIGSNLNGRRQSNINSGGIILPSEIQEAFGLSVSTTGNAGNLSISSPEIRIEDFGQIAVLNQGTGDGGNVTIDTDSISLANAGAISAATVSGEGGNITLNSQDLQLFNQSQVTASAGGSGNGGNITIDSNTILGVENSDITANALAGNGGNITIDSDFIVGLKEQSQLTPQSDITASSEFGFDGFVTINSPDNNLGEDAVAVFKNYTQVKNRELLRSTCVNSRNSHAGKLVYVGRGGIPENPYNFFGDESITQIRGVQTSDSSDRSLESDVWIEGDPIIEPNTVKTTANGEVYLVSETQIDDVDLGICVSKNK